LSNARESSGRIAGRPDTSMESETLTPSETRQLLESGIDVREVAERLVATGCWSESGAAEIVAFLTRGPDVLMKLNLTKTQKSTLQLRQSVIP
jgi:hypothetical protein